jgi:hypothetical protein
MPRERIPVVDDLIDDLVAYHTASDPADKHGFCKRSLWEWRLGQYGYHQLFEDWLLVKQQGCLHSSKKLLAERDHWICTSCMKIAKTEPPF